MKNLVMYLNNGNTIATVEEDNEGKIVNVNTGMDLLKIDKDFYKNNHLDVVDLALEYVNNKNRKEYCQLIPCFGLYAASTSLEKAIRASYTHDEILSNAFGVFDIAMLTHALQESVSYFKIEGDNLLIESYYPIRVTDKNAIVRYLSAIALKKIKDIVMVSSDYDNETRKYTLVCELS